MKRILHVITQNDRMNGGIILEQAKEAHVELIFLHEPTVLEGIDCYRLVDKNNLLEDKGFLSVTYAGMIEKIFGADTVITW